MRRFAFTVFLSALLAGCQESLEERAARDAREFTETKCPMPIGGNMLLDSVVFDIPTLTQSQFFRVMGSLDNDSLFAQADSRSLLVAELRNAPSYRPLMDRGVNFRYVYRSGLKPSHVLLELTLTPDDYRR